MLSTVALLGLAATVHGAWQSADVGVTGFLGYKYPVKALDGKTVQLTFDWSATTLFPATFSYTTRVAVNVYSTNPSTGSSAALTAYYDSSGTNSTAASDGAPEISATRSAWFCGDISLFPDKKMQVTFTVKGNVVDDLNGGTSFEAVAFSYRYPTSFFPPTGPGSSTATMGWSRNACLGQTTAWQGPVDRTVMTDSTDFSNQFQDDAENSALTARVRWEPVSRPAQKESFTADWDLFNFGRANDALGMMQSDKPSQSGLGTNRWNLGPSVFIEKETFERGLGLYAKIRMDTALPYSPAAFLCFQSDLSGSNDGVPTLELGNSLADEVNFWAKATNINTYCDLGCYPQENCDEYTNVYGNWNLENAPIPNSDSDGFYAHVIVVDQGSSVGNPNPRVAFAWGHLPDSAIAVGPSALLGLAALYLATQA